MGTNTFGTHFRITTWGESHGKAIGVVIDGCPAGVLISEEEINQALSKRAPGKAYTSPRKEPDHAEILSGVFEGQTTGTPISILIPNQDADSSAYEPVKDVLRPGHANWTFTKKYGVFDWRGGGRASARETACRVAAGAIATKLLTHANISLFAYLKEMGPVSLNEDPTTFSKETVEKSPLFCPNPTKEKEMIQVLEKIKEKGDSHGGVVELIAQGLPVGLGDPVYEKVEAKLASAMLSIPACKGFEIGAGFAASKMRGSEHNDLFTQDFQTETNHAGGTLGGITTGMPLIVRASFKPTSSIKKSQESVTFSGESTPFQLPPNSRHDPCVAIRAVPVVEAMGALVFADLLLAMRLSKISFTRDE